MAWTGMNPVSTRIIRDNGFQMMINPQSVEGMMETDNTIRILLVDDEEKFLNSLAERLKLLGFDPLKASSGRQALELAKNNRIDIRERYRQLTLPSPGAERDFTGHGKVLQMGRYTVPVLDLSPDVDVCLRDRTFRLPAKTSHPHTEAGNDQKQNQDECTVHICLQLNPQRLRMLTREPHPVQSAIIAAGR